MDLGPVDHRAALRGLGLAISALDEAEFGVDTEWYVRMRRELVNVYLDLLGLALQPYDQDGKLVRPPIAPTPDA